MAIGFDYITAKCCKLNLIIRVAVNPTINKLVATVRIINPSIFINYSSIYPTIIGLADILWLFSPLINNLSSDR